MPSRVNCAWQNFPGAPGVSVFWLENATQARVDAIRTFFNSIAGLIPTGTTITVPGSGDVLNDSDGKISSTWSVTTPPAVVTGTGAGAYAGQTGMVVHWLTAGVINGRRLRGRTFIVPTVNTTFETNGSPTSAAINTLNTAANTLVGALGLDFVVWSRPVKAHTKYDPESGAPTNVPARAGSTANVTGVRVPDLAITLRSRRV